MSYGFIQWKGTSACMDINCSCGKQTHIDESFAYYVQCPYCKAVYELGSTIEFKPVAPADVAKLTIAPRVGFRSEHPEDDDL